MVHVFTIFASPVVTSAPGTSGSLAGGAVAADVGSGAGFVSAPDRYLMRLQGRLRKIRKACLNIFTPLYHKGYYKPIEL